LTGLTVSYGNDPRATSQDALVGIPPKIVADYVHDIIEADRSLYSSVVVERMQKKSIVHATENWNQQDGLPLPAQLLQMAGRHIAEKGRGIRFRLVSLWPIYERNSPATEFERQGLQAVLKNPDEPFMGVIKSGKLRYYQAIYADKAVTQACVDCHNKHPLSPKRDFQPKAVMGGIVITIPLNG
jgi:hypothetical protein